MLSTSAYEVRDTALTDHYFQCGGVLADGELQPWCAWLRSANYSNIF